MRTYVEPCLRNLQDKMKILGFEEFDIFIVLGVFLSLQAFQVNTVVVLLVGSTVAGLLLFIKKGKPPQTVEHCIQWFFKPKEYTAIPQSLIDVIRGRGLDIRLNALQELLPYSHLEDEFIVFKDDSVSVGYLLECPYVGNYSQEEAILYSSKIETLLNNLTERASYQIIFDLDGSYQDTINEHSIIKNKNYLIAGMHQERINKLKGIEENNVFRRIRCFLFVNYRGVEAKKKTATFVQGFRKFKDVCEDEVARIKSEFINILESVEGGLNGAGFKYERLNPYEFMKLIYGYMNPDRVNDGLLCPRPKANEVFSKQVCCSDLAIDQDAGEYMHWGGKYHKFTTLKILPESTNPLMLTSLLNLSFKEFDVVINFESPPKEWGKKAMRLCVGANTAIF